MKLILTESVENLGTIGEVVDVAAGYGRNCLMLGQKAIPATSGNMKMLENKMKNSSILFIIFTRTILTILIKKFLYHLVNFYLLEII